jgi:hypothetical protein
MKSLLVAAVLAGPALARACPTCARDSSAWAPFLIGTMIVLPWVVGLTVFRIVRRGEAGFRP